MNYEFDSLQELLVDKIIESMSDQRVNPDDLEWLVNDKLERIAQILVDDARRLELEE